MAGFDDDWMDGSFDGMDAVPYSDEEDDPRRDLGVDELTRLGKEAATQGIFATTRSDGWKRGLPPVGPITNMVVANKTVIMSTKEGKVLRWMSGAPTEIMPVTAKPDERVHKLFIDPRGNHVLFTVVSARDGAPQTYYLHSMAPSPEKVGKAIRNNVVIDSVAWDKQATKHSASRDNSGSALVGTIDGSIFEAVFESKKGGAVTCRLFRHLFSLPLSAPICGLEWERFPGDRDRRFVMACTATQSASKPTRYYQFVGGPTFEALFGAVPADPPFGMMPNPLKYSQLVFHSSLKHRSSTSTAFALFTGSGIFNGRLQYGSQSQGDSVIARQNLLMFPKRTHRGPDAGRSGHDRGSGAGGAGAGAGRGEDMPIGMAMTEYHFLLLYPDALVAVSRVSKEMVWEEKIESKKGASYRGIVVDPFTQVMWLYSDKGLSEVIKKDEDRDVWRLYLELAQSAGTRDADAVHFETALSHCKTAEQKDEVITAQADHMFAQRNLSVAAELYAKTTRSFEEVALKFINIQERAALKAFLMYKLADLKADATIQRTILCTWLTEIFLDELNSLQDLDDDPEQQSILHSTLLNEFQTFLKQHQDSLNEATTFHLISSHGRVDVLLFYAELVKDYTRVLTHYVQHREWEKALRTLREAPTDTAAELFYKFSPQLILNEPALTIKAWKRARFLDPKKLIPALVRYSQKQETLPPSRRDNPNQAIIYLDFQVISLGNEDPAIHNYLLSLFAKQDDDTDLLRFIQRQTNGHKEPVFDLKYALRVCTREGKDRACVYIYSAMQLYEEAVELALKVDVELAKLNAQMPDDDEELMKKLWLRIAHYVIEQERNVRKAIELVGESELLKIEDVLKFFPDFVTIDEFKAEITDSLRECNSRITDLKSEMKDYTTSADRIRDDIKALRNRYGYVQASQKCELCDRRVLDDSFYLFPCAHAFHADCLVKEVAKMLSPVRRERLHKMAATLAGLERAAERAGGDGGGRGAGAGSGAGAGAGGAGGGAAAGREGGPSRRETLQAELDDCVASECLFCGDLMINSVAEPLGADSMDRDDEWAI